MNNLIRWLFCKPNESDLFGVNFREAVQCLFGHTCEWEFRPDIGEEEHGLNYAKRYCKICGKCQRRYFHRFGDIRMTWEDEILPESIKLP
jgi:hypothetical protein